MVARSVSIIMAVLIVSFGAFSGDPVIGEKAPEFTLTDTHGNTHSLSDYRGKIVVLEWTNPNCPFVVRHYVDDLMPALQREFGESGVVWFAVNSTHPDHRDFESNESLNEIFAEWNAAYRAQLVDLDGSVGRAYNAQTTPHMYIIDSNGILVYNGGIDDDPRGSMAFESRQQFVRDALERLLRGEPVDVATTRPYGCTVKYTKDT